MERLVTLAGGKIVRENGVENFQLEEGKSFLIVQANGCREPFDKEELRRRAILHHQQQQPGEDNGGEEQQAMVIKEISESGLINSLGRMELQID